MKEITND